MSFTTAALLLSWTAIVVLALALAGVIQQVRALSATAPGAAGSMGPAIGEPVPGLGAGADPVGPALVLFADRECAACGSVVPALADERIPEGVRKIAVYRDAAPADGDDTVMTLSRRQDAFAHWRVPVTPFCVAVDAGGRVAAAGPVGAPAALRKIAMSLEGRAADAAA